MSKRHFRDYQNLGSGRLRYAIDGAHAVKRLAIVDPLGVAGEVDLMAFDICLESDNGEEPYDSVVIDIGERHFPAALVVTGEWDKAKDDE